MKNENEKANAEIINVRPTATVCAYIKMKNKNMKNKA